MLNIRGANAHSALPTNVPLSNVEFAVGAPGESSMISEGIPMEVLGTNIQVDAAASMADTTLIFSELCYSPSRSLPGKDRPF